MSSRASPHALRAFVEVARQRGVTPAARLLSISPSAVSHLLRELETGLGVALFRPGSRRAVLTEAGERLALGIGGAFDTIDRAVSDLLRGSGGGAGFHPVHLRHALARAPVGRIAGEPAWTSGAGGH